MEQTPTFKSRGIKMWVHSPLCEGNSESPRLSLNKEFCHCNQIKKLIKTSKNALLYELGVLYI